VQAKAIVLRTALLLSVLKLERTPYVGLLCYLTVLVIKPITRLEMVRCLSEDLANGWSACTWGCVYPARHVASPIPRIVGVASATVTDYMLLSFGMSYQATQEVTGTGRMSKTSLVRHYRTVSRRVTHIVFFAVFPKASSSDTTAAARDRRIHPHDYAFLLLLLLATGKRAQGRSGGVQVSLIG
jgi:hypothetical protein